MRRNLKANRRLADAWAARCRFVADAAREHRRYGTGLEIDGDGLNCKTRKTTGQDENPPCPDGFWPCSVDF